MPRLNSAAIRDVHATAITRFDEIQAALYDERMQCLSDRRFYAIPGAQWEGPLEEQFANKPRFEVNKVYDAVQRVVNEFRNNSIDVMFVPKNGVDDELSDTCAALYRADAYDSDADEAIDAAFEEAAAGGIGAWRLSTRYEDDEDDDDDRQRIYFSPINDADTSVFWDLNSKKMDKSDAKFCFVVQPYSRQAYKAEWGDDPAQWPKAIQKTQFDWCTPDVVYVAEYYVIEQKSYEVRTYVDAIGNEDRFTVMNLDAEELAEREEDYANRGYTLKKTKKVKKNRVHKYIMSGNKVLEDCGLIAGPNIPIVMIYGKRTVVDNLERAQGRVRLAKDPQRLKNMQVSKLAVLSVKSSQSKPIFTPEQIAGHTVMWSEDDVKDYPYLMVNAMIDANGQKVASGPIAYTKPPEIPPAMSELLNLTEADMRQILGINPEAEKMVANISDDAVNNIRDMMDTYSYVFISNAKKALRRCGTVWLGMAAEVYVEEKRQMKGLDVKHEPTQIVLNIPKVDEKSGEVLYKNDLSKAKLDVIADVGPKTTSRRKATLRGLMDMLKLTNPNDQETQSVLSSVAIMNMDGEGLSDVRSYFRMKLIKAGVIKPTPEEAAELEATSQPDPTTEYLKSAAEQASAEAAKARAGTVLDIAKAEESQARSVKIMSEVDEADQRQALEVIRTFAPEAVPQQQATTQPGQ